MAVLDFTDESQTLQDASQVKILTNILCAILRQQPDLEVTFPWADMQTLPGEEICMEKIVGSGTSAMFTIKLKKGK